MRLLLQCMALGFGIVGLSAQAEPVDEIFVETTTVKRSNLSEFEFSQGTVFARRRSYLVFQGQGHVTYVGASEDGATLREGDFVKGPDKENPKGQLLAELNREGMDAAVQGAMAELDTARSNLETSLRDYQRVQRLQKIQAIDSRSFDAVENTYMQSQAAVKAAEARLRQTQVDVDYLQIRAPFDGQIAFSNVRVGQYFGTSSFDSTSDLTATRTAAMVIIDPSSYEVVIDLPLFSGKKVEVGQSAYLVDQELLAEIQVGSQVLDESRIFQLMTPARISAVSPAVDPAKRSIRVRAVTDNLESDHGLIDGGFVAVWIETDVIVDALTVPLEAILGEGNSLFGFVVTERGEVEKREITVGRYGNEGVEVLSGLIHGERVVTKGNAKLKSGQKVRLANTKSSDKPLAE